MKNQKENMIIDVHTHLNNYHEERVVSIQDCLADLHTTMKTNGVDCALVLTSYKVTEHRPSTSSVIEATRGMKDIFVVAGISYLNYTEKDLRELSGYLQEGLVKGLKLYPGYEPFYPYDNRLKVVYDLAIEYDVPVMFHSGDTYAPQGKVRFSHPLHIDDVAVDYPELKIVICHVGNPWIIDCMEVVYKNPNVYADISGLVLGEFSDQFEKYMKAKLEEMILFTGNPKKLLFGTDWPICSMSSYIKFMKGLDISDEKKELMMWKNAVELFKIDVESLK